MGFISKAIFVTTGVPGVTSSVKQKQLKAQRAQLAEMKMQTNLMRDLADPTGAAQQTPAARDAHAQTRHEARLASLAQNRANRDLAAQRRQELRDARGPITVPPLLRAALRLVAYALSGLFAFAALGALLESSYVGMLICLAISAIIAGVVHRGRTPRPADTE
jgi:hypothetical protein